MTDDTDREEWHCRACDRNFWTTESPTHCPYCEIGFPVRVKFHDDISSEHARAEQ